MNLADRIFPKAKDFQSFAPPEGELPRKAFPFIWIFVKALRWPAVTITLVYAIGSACFMFEPYFIGYMVEAITTAPADQVWHASIKLLMLYIVVCQILARICYAAGLRSMLHFLSVLTVSVRRRLAQYLFTHSYRFFQDDYAGRLAGKVVEMPQATNEVVETLLDSCVYGIANFAASTFIFANIKWYFGFSVVLLYLATATLCWICIPKISVKAELSSSAVQRMRGRYIDSITNVLLVKLFAREAHEDRLFSSAIVDASAASQSQGHSELYLWNGQHVINGIFQVTVTVLALCLYRRGEISLGSVATVLTLAAALVSTLWWMLRAAMTLFTKFATINEALKTIIVPTEVRDIVEPKALPLPRADIAFDHVTFAYTGRPIFADFTLDIPQGQRVGLVGPSGAGKSTLVQLVLRLFDVENGAIKIGGQDIAHVAQNDLRGAIAMIPQATDLMHRSIRDNIAYGNLDASEEQIVEAAKRAYIHDTITGLKDSHGNSGYDALVGERGVKLSGGQRQRIAIARAFLKNAPILILDEATSALDSESERLIQVSLNELFQGRTVLAIAHRLSTIAHLDRIVVLDEGRIVEDGPHAALVNAGGLYARLWQLQSEGFIGG